MPTTYEIALNEFRDASAAVRRAFGAVAEARELQIIADSQHKHASNAHAEAVSRLERADAALTQARAAPAGEVYDATGETPATAALFSVQGALATTAAFCVTQAEIDALGAPLTNGSIDAQAAGIGIG